MKIFISFLVLAAITYVPEAQAGAREILLEFVILETAVENEIVLQGALQNILENRETLEEEYLEWMCVTIVQKKILSTSNRVRALNILAAKNISSARAALLKLQEDPSFFENLDNRSFLQINLALTILRLTPIDQRQDHELAKYIRGHLDEIWNGSDLRKFLELLIPSAISVEFLESLINQFTVNSRYQHAGFLEALIAGIETQKPQAAFDSLERLSTHTIEMQSGLHKQVRDAMFRSIQRRMHSCSEDLRLLLANW
jgi:hypothetical protein